MTMGALVGYVVMMRAHCEEFLAPPIQNLAKLPQTWFAFADLSGPGLVVEHHHPKATMTVHLSSRLSLRLSIAIAVSSE